MTIYDVLRHEHYVIRAYLARIQELGRRRPATRLRHFRQLQTLVVAHAAAVEAIFHASLYAYEPAAELARRGRIRHDVAGSLMEVLAGLEPEDADWTAYFAVLAEVLETQMREAEKELFRAARKVLDDGSAEDMGAAMREAGKGGEALAQAEIQPPSPGEGSRSLH